MWQIMNAEENGHKPEQFTGIAYEIVSRSYKMDEIMKNPNYPKPGRNIYDNEADYSEASKLQDEYQKLLEQVKRNLENYKKKYVDERRIKDSIRRDSIKKLAPKTTIEAPNKTYKKGSGDLLNKRPLQN